MIEKTEAILLLNRKWGDTSKILNAYSRDFGVLSLLAKGAYAKKSKFGASLELFSYSALTFYNKPKRDLLLLSDSEIVVPIRKLHQSLEHFISAMLISETIINSKEHIQANPEMFEYLLNCILELNDWCENPFSVYIGFALYSAEIMGFGLHADEIADSKGLQFIIADGYFTENSPKYSKNHFGFDAQTKELLIKLINISPIESKQINISKPQFMKILNFITEYYSFHHEKHFAYKAIELIDL